MEIRLELTDETEFVDIETVDETTSVTAGSNQSKNPSHIDMVSVWGIREFNYLTYSVSFSDILGVVNENI